MSTVLEPTLDSEVMPPFPVRRWTLAEYRHLAEIGVLTEDDNVELLEGWIVPKITKNPPHEWTVTHIDKLLHECVGADWVKRNQCAINTSDSEPEPDHSVVRAPEDRYLKHHPQGDDIGLVIEVAHASLFKDRRKAAMYAAEGIPRYWIINLVDRQIEAHSSPDPAHRVYQKLDTLHSGDVIDLILDGAVVVQVPVDQILPPDE